MRPVPVSSAPALLAVLTLLRCPLGLHGCSLPPRIKHGHHKDVSQFLSFTTEVEYECEEGYILVGAAKISCLFSGWSSPAPQCKAMCLKPEIPNGKLFVEKAQYVSPETVLIQCDPGYRMVGSPRISCSDYKSWSPNVPKCEKKVPGDHEILRTGQDISQCLPNPQDSKVALELYKLSLEIEKLEQKNGKETRL
ncbi:C4b-binding protein alpha chain-like [Tenrec ecaudatus]|uniref:C4b-binding protein alpha chain-like n=1 Tax=Tenrec ecaudatus TaxID=94439 RepID=UPI003F59480B